MQSTLNPVNPLASSFVAPLNQAVELSQATSYDCDVLTDEVFLHSGINRVLDATESGRDHLQKIAASLPDPESDPVKRSTYFEGLKSERRLAHAREVARNVADKMASDGAMPDLLADTMPMLKEYEVFAGDGHWHDHAVHDKANPTSGNKYATGHLYGLNLRSRALFHLTAADQKNRKKEHDMRGLKRQSNDTLRQGAAKGKKVIWLWDPAGIDFQQWYQWKMKGGIYFISPVKANMLTDEGRASNVIDRTDPINEGVVSDCLWVGSAAGVMLRLVTYKDPTTGTMYEFVTSLTDAKKIPPGIIAHLYRMRWDIEKVFDEVKNKLHETKAWATSETAKSIQATFICLRDCGKTLE